MLLAVKTDEEIKEDIEDTLDFEDKKDEVNGEEIETSDIEVSHNTFNLVFDFMGGAWNSYFILSLTIAFAAFLIGRRYQLFKLIDKVSDFFTWVVDTTKALIDFVWTIIDGTLKLLEMIPEATKTLTDSLDMLPYSSYLCRCNYYGIGYFLNNRSQSWRQTMIETFVWILKSVRENILEKFMLPGLGISYWDFVFLF